MCTLISLVLCRAFSLHIMQTTLLFLAGQTIAVNARFHTLLLYTHGICCLCKENWFDSVQSTRSLVPIVVGQILFRHSAIARCALFPLCPIDVTALCPWYVPCTRFLEK